MSLPETAPLTLEESAARLGGFRWTEMRLFELLGGWVGSVEDLALKASLDRHSQHAAWRAAQWWDRLPVLASVERADLVQAPSAAVSAAVGELGTTEGVVPRLAGAYRVLIPRLAVGYRDHRGLMSTVADGPVLRTLGQVLPDLIDDWLAGEALLQHLLVDPPTVDLAAASVARLEAVLTGCVDCRTSGGGRESNPPRQDHYRHPL